jgi:hypothetical protein
MSDLISSQASTKVLIVDVMMVDNKQAITSKQPTARAIEYILQRLLSTLHTETWNSGEGLPPVLFHCSSVNERFLLWPRPKRVPTCQSQSAASYFSAIGSNRVKSTEIRAKGHG